MRLDPGDPYVFAVEDDSLQLTWGSLPSDDLTVEVGNIAVAVPASPPAFLYRKGRPPRRIGAGPVGPGAVTVAGLEPLTSYEVCMTGGGRPRRRVARVKTLQAPPGPLMARFATVNDTHLGERFFGASATITDVIPLPRPCCPTPNAAPGRPSPRRRRGGPA